MARRHGGRYGWVLHAVQRRRRRPRRRRRVLCARSGGCRGTTLIHPLLLLHLFVRICRLRLRLVLVLLVVLLVLVVLLGPAEERGL